MLKLLSYINIQTKLFGLYLRLFETILTNKLLVCHGFPAKGVKFGIDFRFFLSIK